MAKKQTIPTAAYAVGQIIQSLAEQYYVVAVDKRNAHASSHEDAGESVEVIALGKAIHNALLSLPYNCLLDLEALYRVGKHLDTQFVAERDLIEYEREEINTQERKRESIRTLTKDIGNLAKYLHDGLANTKPIFAEE